MRYLVTARLKPEKRNDLLDALEQNTLGRGSVAFGEYARNMKEARLLEDGSAHWVEVCYCSRPLDEERAYWEPYFTIVSIEDAHDRENCRDVTGEESYACGECDCTERFEEELSRKGKPFLSSLRAEGE